MAARNEVHAPHPVPLPMGEGTPELPLRIVQGSLLPWGEGQDEGRFPSSSHRPRPRAGWLLTRTGGSHRLCMALCVPSRQGAVLILDVNWFLCVFNCVA